MEQNVITIKDGKVLSYMGKDAVNLFGMRVLLSGLKLFVKTGMIPNRSYTPTNMMSAAMQATGKIYKRRDYQSAIDDLTLVINSEWEKMPKIIE